jgi:hypothetical protein
MPQFEHITAIACGSTFLNLRHRLVSFLLKETEERQEITKSISNRNPKQGNILKYMT